MTARGDVGVDTRLMAVGTCAGGDPDLAVEVRVEVISGSVLSASAVVSKILALANAQL